MWKRLLRHVHPDAGGDGDLFVWVRELQEHVAGHGIEPLPQDVRREPPCTTTPRTTGHPMHDNLMGLGPPHGASPPRPTRTTMSERTPHVRHPHGWLGPSWMPTRSWISGHPMQSGTPHAKDRHAG